MSWLECVPNVSAAGESVLFEEIESLLNKHPNAHLLGRESNASANRTVITFIVKEESLIEVGLAFLKLCEQHINMFLQKGEHPRMGACDVFPIIPEKGKMELAVRLAKELGYAAAEQLGMPGYFYESAAILAKNRNLAQARCSYEQLAERIIKEPFDFGAGLPYARSGATAIGARPLLLAVNFSLAKPDLKLAKKVAGLMRESGNKRSAGMYQGLKALGWYLEDLDSVQVSCNVCRTEVCNLFDLFHSINEELNKKDNEIFATEIIGLLPERVLLNNNPFPGDTAAKINFAIEHLKLSELRPFKPEEKILDYKLSEYLDEALEFETLSD